MGATWQCVVELEVSEGTCNRVRVHVLGPATHTPQPAWGAFTLTLGDAVEVYVFAEDGDIELSKARASAANLEARDS